MSARFILLRALQSGGPIRCSVKHIRSSDLAKKDDEAYREILVFVLLQVAESTLGCQAARIELVGTEIATSE